MTKIPSDRANPQEQDFFLPDLCARESVFFLVLVAELFSIVIVLLQEDILHFNWGLFGLVSLFIQWVALSSAALLCWMRGFLQRIPQRRALLISYLVIPLNAWLAGATSQALFSSWQGLSLWQSLLAPAVLTEVAIAAIIGGLVIRYFYLQAMLIARRQSELLHRIQALQSRIRPHFLFNSMNIIASLIETDPDTAESDVEDLSALFRASLNHVGNQVSLDEEIAICKKFLRIEQLRLGKRLDVQWDVRNIPQEVQIPLLTLQPILENAVLHGIQPLPQGGIIEITGRYRHGVLELAVVNSRGAPQEIVEDQGNHMALDNIKNRLFALYGERARLTSYPEANRFVTRLSYPFELASNSQGK